MEFYRYQDYLWRQDPDKLKRRIEELAIALSITSMKNILEFIEMSKRTIIIAPLYF